MNAFSTALAEAHIADLHREAATERNRALAQAARRNASLMPHAVTLRLSARADAAAITRLAAFDSSKVPAAPLLIAVADDELLAALSLHDGVVIADPFRPTVQLAQLLRKRAKQLHNPSPRLRWFRSTIRWRTHRYRDGGLAPQPR